MKTVLFVCVHNSGRSQMAEAFFNQKVADNARALSAGTQPAESVNQNVIQVMHEVGLDISNKKPRLLTSEMVAAAGKTITMGCGVEVLCPVGDLQIEDWALEDPEGKTIMQVREIRDRIRQKVVELKTG